MWMMAPVPTDEGKAPGLALCVESRGEGAALDLLMIPGNGSSAWIYQTSATDHSVAAIEEEVRFTLPWDRFDPSLRLDIQGGQIAVGLVAGGLAVAAFHKRPAGDTVLLRFTFDDGRLSEWSPGPLEEYWWTSSAIRCGDDSGASWTTLAKLSDGVAEQASG